MNAESRSGLTDQQATAVERRGTSIHLSSGAGCGKTHVLIARYLSHLVDDGAEVGQIVAITFTERAARQMRERVRTTLRAERSAASAESRPLWDRRLRDLETAPISTIHAFCGNLLRRHAAEVGLDPQFEILDAVLSLNVRHAALREGMNALLLEETPAGESLRELTVALGWHRLQSTVLRLIGQYDAEAWAAFLAQSAEQHATAMAAVRRRLLHDFIPYLRHGDATVGRHLGTLLTLKYADGGLPNALEDVLLRLDDLPNASNLANAYAELDERLRGPAALKKLLSDKGRDGKALEKALTGLRETLELRMEAFLGQDEDDGTAFRISQHFIRAASELAVRFRERKREMAVVDFDDLLSLARRLVAENQAVREDLSNRYRFILLDELQDTDPTQMDLVENLCGPALKFGKLFAVGDAKQSIYRFRGAEVSLFEELRAQMPEEGRLDLSRNFRSREPILKFVNALCAPAFANYVPLVAHRTRPFDVPAVEFLWSYPEDTEAKKEPVEETRRREARFLARRIRELIDSGEPRVWDEGTRAFRAPRAGDITILFRSMTNAPIYEEALRNAEIDYYLIGGRAFFAQQEIFDVLNVLRAVENPNDAVALAGVLRSPFGGLSDEALFLISQNGSVGDLWDRLHASMPANLSLDERGAAERIARNLDRWRAGKDRATIADLLRAIVEDTGYDAALQFEFLGDRKLANLWKLVDLARSFDENGQFGLSDFIDRLAELVDRQPREEEAATLPESADVVKLMTIHQSKGLEFPIAIVADFNAKSGGSPEGAAVWHRELGCVVNPPSDEEPPLFSKANWKLAGVADQIAEWREEQRVLYVACTRAQDVLILSAGFAKSPAAGDPWAHLWQVEPNDWTMLLGRHFDLRTGDFLGNSADDPKVRIAVASCRGEPGEANRKKARADRGANPLPMDWYGQEGVRTLPDEIDLNALWNLPIFPAARTIAVHWQRLQASMGEPLSAGNTLLVCRVPWKVADNGTIEIPEAFMDALPKSEWPGFVSLVILSRSPSRDAAVGKSVRIGITEVPFDLAALASNVKFWMSAAD